MVALSARAVVREGVDEDVLREKRLFVLVAAGSTVGAWVLLIAMVSWVWTGMEIVAREYAGHRWGGVGRISKDVRALAVCEVGTLLIYYWMDVESNLCVAE